MNIRIIEYGSDDFRQECDLRNRVLREPLGRSLYNEDLASEVHQAHFGLFDDSQNLVACVVAVLLSSAESKIRQMAVSSACQKQGYGRQIIRSLEDHLVASGYIHISMHARTSAVGFYEKLGYTIIGKEFIEIGLPHFRMGKCLSRHHDESRWFRWVNRDS